MNFGQYGHRLAVSRSPTFSPGGYLSPVAGATASASDQTVSTLFYGPDAHNGLPLMRGGQFEFTAFNEEPISVAGLAANSIFDLYAFDHRGAGKFGWSPAWQSATAGAGARGTLPGSIEQVRIDGLITNRYPIQILNSGVTRLLGEKQGTWLASVCIGSTPGQVVLHRTYGQSRRWDVWNNYNRKRLYLKAGDSTASWVPASLVSYGPARGQTANSLTAFCGLDDESVQFSAFEFGVVGGVATTPGVIGCAVGFNSTSTPSGPRPQIGGAVSAGGMSVYSAPVADFLAPPYLGTAIATLLEVGSLVPVLGGESGNRISAEWRG